MKADLIRRLLLLFGVPAVVFGGFATLVNDALSIQILNAIRLSLSIGVLVAYAPPVVGIVFDPEPLDRPAYLSIGIVWSWLGACLSGVWWVAFQLSGRPPGMSNNDFVALTIFLSCLGALHHLAAPGALNKRVPPMRWVKIGGLVAVGVFGALAVFNAADIRFRVHQVLPIPHDRAQPPA